MKFSSDRNPLRTAVFLGNGQGELAIALAPTCQDVVTAVYYSTSTGYLAAQFEGEDIPYCFGSFSDRFDGPAVNACEILIAHFANAEDYLNCDSSKEYEVPFFCES